MTDAYASKVLTPYFSQSQLVMSHYYFEVVETAIRWRRSLASNLICYGKYWRVICPTIVERSDDLSYCILYYFTRMRQLLRPRHRQGVSMC